MMCGGCVRCDEPIYGMIQHSPENCINALKRSRDSAREGREMVRKSLTGDLERAHGLLLEIASGHPNPQEAAGKYLENVYGLPK